MPATSPATGGRPSRLSRARTPRAPAWSVLATAVLAACGAGHAAVHSTTTSLTDATTTTAGPTTLPATTVPVPAPTAPPPAPTTPPTAPARLPAAVGTAMLDLTDTSRPTVQNGRELSSSRHLPTIVRYPAAGAAGTGESSGAPPLAGPWPLVLFGHGYNVTPGTYAHLLHAWAAAGFVVAAPSFPLETAGGPLDENDLSNEPEDMSFVINAVLGRSHASAAPLAGLVGNGPVAVTGHSDGAEAALAAGYLGHNPHVGPVISMAAQGIEGGPNHNPRHPLLVVQGDQDTINPPSRSDGVYNAAGPPRYYLHLYGAGHLPPVADDTVWRPIVEQVGIDFLRRTLGAPLGPAVSPATIVADGHRAGVSSVDADP